MNLKEWGVWPWVGLVSAAVVYFLLVRGPDSAGTKEEVIEPEHKRKKEAPRKKRGRKPGSKNKPKLPVVAAGSLPEDEAIETDPETEGNLRGDLVHEENSNG